MKAIFALALLAATLPAAAIGPDQLLPVDPCDCDVFIPDPQWPLPSPPPTVPDA